MTDVKVTVVEVDNTEWAARGYPGFDEQRCTLGLACGTVPIGGYLHAYKSSEDRDAFTIYYEITSEFLTGKPDVDRWCEDCFGYIGQIAPAIVAFNTPPERTTGASTD